MGTALEMLVPRLALLVLVSLRVGVALASLPAPLGALAPTHVRVALGIVLSVALTVPHTGEALTVELDPFWIAGAALSEALVGASIGLTARLCLAAAEIAGEIVGGSIGLGFAQQIDPTSGQETTATARLLEMLAVSSFFAMNGHHAVIAALAQSLVLVPPGAEGVALDASRLDVGAGLVAAGLRIASPVLGTMLVVQLAIAITSRAAPRLQVFTLSFALAASVGLLTLVASLTAISESIHGEIDTLPSRLVEIVAPE